MSSSSVREGGFILLDAPPCNVVGAYIIAGYVALIGLYLGSCWLGRWRRSRGKMSEVASGKFRIAAATGRVDIMVGIKESIDGFDVDCAVLGFTALHAAVCQSEVGAVLWLLQNGAGVDKVKDDGWKYTALHYAACKESQEIVQILVAYGAKLDSENFLGQTAAQLASDMGHRNISMYLDRISKNAGNLEAERRRLLDEYAGRHFERRVGVGAPVVGRAGWDKKVGQVFRADSDVFEAYMRRGFEGYGTEGTVPGKYLPGFRRIAVVYLVISFSYLVWRALRSLNPGWWYFYSVPFFMIELTGWTLGLCFIYSLYYQIDRPSRSITVMLPEDEFPKVDVYICRYSEPVEILEATTVAALNMDYPGDKLSIYVCDDGKSPEVLAMCKRLRYQLRYMDRRANLFYVGRSKKEGVPHHAKAGNINNTLLMHSSEDVQYLMVLDCDMIVHPTFLHRTLSHFYVSDDNGGWRQKEFIGLLQTPQDFWNVDSEDPMVHCARFFYGPMLQGRDGCGACPCCGTGVIFQRSTLVSVGGQSYGSITEDCNTSMQLLSSGFANMFLNERLVYGMAPEDLPGVFQQRARWAMGAIQILYRDNPLRKRGLTMSQSFLFFEIGAHHYLAVGTAMATLVPIIYVYVEASPVIVEYLWEFCIVFGVFFATNRVMIWWAHRGCASGGTLELWRGGQMWIWMCPSHIKSIWKTFVSETNLFGWLGSFELTFKVTSKDEDSTVSFWESLAFASPFVLYILAVIGSTIYFVVMAVVKSYSTWVILMTLTALAWSVYISLCIWPPVSVMIPRVETDHGWKISWETAIDESKLMVDDKNRVVRRPRGKKRLSMRKGSMRADGNGNGSQNAGIRRHDSLVGKVVKEMEEGAVPYDFAGLTKDAINTYRLGMTLGDHDVEGPGSCSDDDIYTSPFAADGTRDVLSHPLHGGDSERAQSHPSPSPEPRKPAGVRHRLVQFGSGIVEGMSTILPSMPSQSLSQKASSMNIGRVALPAKTARGIAGSMYTSMILPEPSKVHFDASRALSARAVSSATADAYHGRSVSWATPPGGDRRDIRAVKVQSMASQDDIRRSLILMEAAGSSKSALVARQLVRAYSQQLAQNKKKNKKKGAAEQQNLADRAMTSSFVETLHRSVVLSEVSEPRVGVKASHTDVVPSGDNARLEPSDADFASPLVDETSMPQAITTETTNETTERDPSFASPFLAADSTASDTKGLESPADLLGSSTTTGPLPGGAAGGHRNRQKFTLTKDGRVLVSGQELALDALLDKVLNEMKFSAGPVGSMGLTSPMLDPQHPGYFSDIQGDAGLRSGAMSMRMGTSPTTGTSASKDKPSGTWSSLPLSSYGSQAPLSPGHTAELASYGRSILHSMRSMSYRQNLPPDSQRVVDMQRRMIPPAVIMGESATSMLGNRLMNQPGSIVMSSLFAQLSQMQPSQLQTQGLVLPVIPDDIFEHTIASRPSFEFRVLPDKTLTFFTVNFLILAGVCAGGIVSIFFGAS